MIEVDAKPGPVICAYQLDGAGGGRSVEDVSNPTGSEEFNWVHLRSNDPGTRQWLQTHNVDENVIDALTATATRPRALNLAGGVLVVLRGVNMNAGADPEDMISLRMWITERQIISTRVGGRQLLSIQDLRNAIERGVGPTSPSSFIATLAELLANRIGEFVDEMDDRLASIETLDDHNADVRRALSDIRRQNAAIRRYLAPQRDALDALYRMRGVLSEDDAFVLREQTDRTTRYVEDLELARERAVMLHEERQSAVAAQQNARMYVLSLVTAVFLPLSFLTGLFGMNVGGLPGTDSDTAFLLLMLAMVVLAVAVVVLLRAKKWL